MIKWDGLGQSSGLWSWSERNSLEKVLGLKVPMVLEGVLALGKGLVARCTAVL